jgi:nucleotide-binding universal stress UspA family protein
MFKHILIPTDGSELSEKTVKAGVDFAKSIGAKVTGFCAIENYPWIYGGEFVPLEVLSPQERQEQDRRWAQGNLAIIQEYAHSVQVPYEGYHVAAGAPHEAIIQAAKEKGCDLIFMASHGRRGLAGLLLGSVTMKVLTHSKIPVLVYR